MDNTPQLNFELALENLTDDLTELASVLNEINASLLEFQKAINDLKGP